MIQNLNVAAFPVVAQGRHRGLPLQKTRAVRASAVGGFSPTETGRAEILAGKIVGEV